MDRINRKDMEQLVARIEALAKELDLLPEDGSLTYIPKQAGLAPGVGATVHASRNGRRYVATGVSFLPVFHRGRNTTTTEAWIILSATEEALRAVVNHQGATYADV
jgi:hypothetical protein